MITCSAPGKLFVVGEYAVVEPGRLAILVAVDRRVSVTVSPGELAGRVAVRSDLYSGTVEFVRVDARLVPCVDDSGPAPRLNHVVSAIETVERLIVERGLPVRPLTLDITSELHEDGTKFGLGSSGAVTVATISAVGAFYGLDLTPEQRYRLAMLATARIAARASGGDLAASVWGGWIAYSAPDRTDILGMAERLGIDRAIHAEWPGFSIKRLQPPADLTFEVGWTGVPAATDTLVAGLAERNRNNDSFYRSFLWRSDECVRTCIAALRDGENREFLRQIRRFRDLLQTADGITRIGIFTPRMTTLCDTVEKVGGAAKPSGAGGGDCGIAFLDNTAHHQLETLRARWRAAGIRPLSIRVPAVEKEARDDDRQPQG
ncbi:phosphomevalonate kinase [Nocardia iowensis]|uniref:Phosphomevalonate kinase n=1 Tax=Nocardia iowensis TaxID=204891 RepID=A0ABX8RKD3_NOCIO|nr:phosphomevalonate kinase [Nocardia iowensis]QXN90070.1 phosphomevalonate kinase [Nocardia iowensis]